MSETATATAALEVVRRGPFGSPIGGVGFEIILAALAVGATIFLVRRFRRRSAPGAEAVAWGGFILACVLRLALVDPQMRLGGAVLVALLGLGLSATVGVEIAWGLAVRLDPALRVGTQIVVDDLEGRIRRLRSRWVEVETSDGWLVRVPYRRLSRGIRIRSAGHRTALPVRFELEIPPDGDVAAARVRARELVLCSPWANLSPAPEVEVDEGGRPVLRVEAYTFGREGRSRLVADVLSAWRT